jgi:large subunit ribosomal protein L21
MYAIIRSGGKQAKVAEGDLLDVEQLRPSNDVVRFTPLLVVKDDGSLVSHAKELAQFSVEAEVVGPSQGPKVDVYRYKSKTGYHRGIGHRQRYTTLRITGIQAASKPAKAAEKEVNG